jgi:flagella basal body P-ring formation protein FlgA
VIQSLFIAFLIAVSGNESGMGDTRQVIIDKAMESIHVQYDEESYRFEISARWIPGSLLKADPSAIQSVQLEGRLSKYSNFEVVYEFRNRTESTEIQLLVETEQYLPVLAQRLTGGQKLTHDLFDWRWVPVNLERDEVIDSIERLSGSTLRRTVNAGQPIEASFISTPLMIRAGEEVDMLYSGDGIDIIMTCEARKDGALTEEIQIYCKETRRKYLARVTGQGEATWIKTK